MTVKKNDEIELQIDGFTAEGSGVGHYNGMAIFVPGGAKGDTVLCHIIKAKKSYAIGKIVRILIPSDDRETPDCPLFSRCGGCTYRHIRYAAEKQLKQQRIRDCFQRIGHLDVVPQPILPGERSRCRNKAQYPVTMENGELKIGFYAEKSHRVINCEDCLLEPEEFARINRIFRCFIEQYHISVYDETTQQGLFRHIYLRKGFATGQIMVTAVLNGSSIPHGDELIAMLTTQIPEIRSIYININRKNTNVVLGEECRLLYGEQTIEDILCGVRVHLHPLSFYQVNHDNAQMLYTKAAELLDLNGNETLLDLYCGTGTIGLSMAHKVKKLIGVEIVPEAVAGAKENARINGVENAEFFCADAEEAARMLEESGIRPDAVILDPPRKGCGETLPHTVNRMHPKKIVYISCDPATLARDCASFAALGWQIQTAIPVDMFPATAHVETVVLLSQRRPDTHIDIKLDLSELDVTAAETKATYQEIKDYVLDKYGFKVSTLYISQVKTKCGIIERENYNIGEGKSRVPQCPKEKETAIMDALKHFKMI